jgi:hypothetical protein
MELIKMQKNAKIMNVKNAHSFTSNKYNYSHIIKTIKHLGTNWN